jgi:hypothetical protein
MTSLHEANRVIDRLRETLAQVREDWRKERRRAERAEARISLQAPLRDTLRSMLTMTRGPRDIVELELLKYAAILVEEGPIERANELGDDEELFS